jgi:uncharacterized protein
MLRPVNILFAVIAVFLLTMGPVLAGEGVHKLALQISDNDEQKMNAVLNVAANASQYYSGLGEEIDVSVVAFNLGLHMFRSDTSPVAERMASFAQSMPNVKFYACNNTRTSMAKKEGKDIPIMENAEVVPAGVIKLMELDAEGYTILRP